MAVATEQLKRLFGEEASTPLQVFIKDWADDPFTSTNEGEMGCGSIDPVCDAWFNREWRHVISLAGSEFNPSEAGFLAGAVTSSTRAVAAWLANYKS